MSKNIKVHLSEGYQIRERGVFNLDKLYKEMYAWLDSNKYDFNEKLHQHKKLERGDEIEVKWEAEREVTDFIRYDIKIHILLIDINSVSDNLVAGYARITFQTNLVLDYKERWSSSKFKNFLFEIYRKVFFKDTISKNVKKLRDEVSDFHKTTKEILDFYR